MKTLVWCLVAVALPLFALVALVTPRAPQQAGPDTLCVITAPQPLFTGDVQAYVGLAMTRAPQAGCQKIRVVWPDGSFTDTR